jgi:hypothetical protein
MFATWVSKSYGSSEWQARESLVDANRSDAFKGSLYTKNAVLCGLASSELDMGTMSLFVHQKVPDP